ncbi:PAS domain S-box protein [Candidatus Riflebacteria bacterium]
MKDSTLKIIVIDDDEALLKLIQKTLTKNGLSSVCFNTGKAALKAIGKNPVLLLLDYRLPDIQAEEFLRKVAKKKRAVPFIVMTGKGDEKIAVNMMKRGASDYLVKDSAFLELLPTVITQTVRRLELERDLAIAKEGLLATEEKYRNLFELGLDSIFILDPRDYSIIDVNEVAASSLGYPQKELLKSNFTLIQPGFSAQTFEKHFKELKKGNNIVTESLHRKKDGVEVPVEGIIRIFDYGGKEVVQAFFRDITERKQAEASLKESRKMLQLVLDSIPARVFWKNLASVYLGCNYPFARDAGINSPDEIVGKVDYELAWKKEEADFFRECDRRVMSSNKPEYHIIEPQLRADGTHAWLDTNKVPLYDNDGRVVGILGTYEDITQRKLAEDSLQKSEERYRQITTAVTDYIFTVRVKNGEVLDTTHGTACEAITGYVSEEFSQNPYLWIGMVPEEDQEKVKQQASNILAGKKPPPLEHRIRRKDGQLRWVRNTLVPHFDATGALIAYDGLIRDITERKQAEEKIKDSEAKVRALLNAPAEAILLVDTRGIIFEGNEEMARVLGKTLEEIMDLCIWNLLPPNLVASRKVENEKVIRYGEIARFEDQHHSRCYENIIYPIFDVEGLVSKTAIFSRDITNLKQKEAALKESEERYKLLVEASFEGLSISVDGIIIEANRAFALMLGYGFQEVIGISPFDLMAPESVRRMMERIGSGIETSFDVEAIKKDGSIIPIEVLTRQLIFRGKRAVVMAFRNITRQNNKDAAVVEADSMPPRYSRESQQDECIIKTVPAMIHETPGEIEKYRAIAEATFEGLAFSVDGKIIEANKSLATILGYDLHEIIGLNILDLTTRESAKEIMLNIARGTDAPFEIYGLKKNGNKIPLELLGKNTIYRGTRARVTAFRDISQRKYSEGILKDRDEKLRLLFSSTAEGIFGIDQEGNFTFTNNAALKMFKYAGEDELLGQKIHSLIHHSREDGSSYPIDECRICSSVGESLHLDSEIFWSKDGNSFPAECWSYPIKKEGKILGSVVTFIDISERKQTEQAIRESEERFRAIADYTCDWESWHGTDGMVLWVNLAVEKLTGYSVSECMSMPHFPTPILHYNDRKYMDEVFPKAAESGSTGNDLPFRIRHKDGSIRWMAVSWQPIYNKEGEYMGFRSSIRDISERKKVEEELKDSTCRFRTAFQTNPDAIIITGLEDGLFVDVNEGFTVLTGYQPDEVIGKTVMEINIWQDSEERKGMVEKLKKDGFVTNLEVKIRRKDGSICSGLASIKRIVMNKKPHVLSIVKDISQWQTDQDFAKYSENRYQSLFDTSFDAILIVDADTEVVLDANKKMGELIRIDPKKLTGKHHSELYPEQDRKRFTEIFIKNSQDDRGFSDTMLVRQDDGQKVPVEICTSIMELGHKKLIQAIFRKL